MKTKQKLSKEERKRMYHETNGSPFVVACELGLLEDVLKCIENNKVIQPVQRMY